MENILNTLKTFNSLYIPYAYALIGFFVLIFLLRMLFVTKKFSREINSFQERAAKRTHDLQLRHQEFSEDFRKKGEMFRHGFRLLSGYLVLRAVFRDYRHPEAGKKASLTRSLIKGARLGQQLHKTGRL